ncbi:hypothetical protein ER308_19930 [Egibacter rhizosphaerae]|uniref:Uncharacterized protein n=1 Tax=Egibacter rhizosphaerae TaxID=1670831 RepID=A0A411YKA4_9ACTN|nr:hypothetical protein [Egibacter rhizosphaerae]QBI21610.1 hypothetical protein ER308_19930 [Egibacter rhizosphaerae]
MLTRILLTVLAGLLLLVAACDDAEPDETPDEAEEEDVEEPEGDDEDEDDAAEGMEDDGAEDLEGAEPPEPTSLEEGTAAIVEGMDITDDEVDALFDEESDIEQFEEQLGEDADVETLVRTELLTELVLGELIVQAADERDVDVTDEDREDAEDAAGEQLDQALEEGQLSEERREMNLERQAMFEALRRDFEGEATEEQEEQAEEFGEQQGGQELTGDDIAMDEWIVERIQTADVEVDEEYGVWDPSGMQMGAPLIQPPEDAMPEQEQPGMGDLEDLEDMDPEDLEDLEDMEDMEDLEDLDQ